MCYLAWGEGGGGTAPHLALEAVVFGVCGGGVGRHRISLLRGPRPPTEPSDLASAMRFVDMVSAISPKKSPGAPPDATPAAHPRVRAPSIANTPIRTPRHNTHGARRSPPKSHLDSLFPATYGGSARRGYCDAVHVRASQPTGNTRTREIIHVTPNRPAQGSRCCSTLVLSSRGNVTSISDICNLHLRSLHYRGLAVCVMRRRSGSWRSWGGRVGTDVEEIDLLPVHVDLRAQQPVRRPLNQLEQLGRPLNQSGGPSTS